MKLLDHPASKVFLSILLLSAVIAGALFIHYYNRYANIIDRRLSGHIFSHPSILFAAPLEISAGEPISMQDVVAHLKASGYSDTKPSPVGTFKLLTDSIEVQPGPESYHSPQPALIRFADRKVDAITDPTNGEALQSYDLEPELLTTLFDEQRSKRRLLKYSDLPPDLMNAILAAEDRDYFHHGAINYWRILAAAYRDFRSGTAQQGASTITQQVARNFFLTSTRTVKSVRRKAAEALIAFELEERLTKEQIFELYANEAYMGQRGTYSINGFGQAASAFFNKDVNQLTLGECALLAGIIHAPNGDSPYRYPERALSRRDWVLGQMYKAGFIDQPRYERALAEPLRLAPANEEASEAPYFVDLVRDQINDKIPERDLLDHSYRIYTTLDLDLQRAAADAVQSGIKEVDQELDGLRKKKLGKRTAGEPLPPPRRPQVALIALDPHTGAIKALIGGRSYSSSQLNHVTANRPTGSIFKPFVYAAALNDAIDNQQPVLTSISTVIDQPTTFEGDYQPANFENKYFGTVTLRQALAHSLNNATISVAQRIGYDRVSDLAHAAGITSVQPTPSEAIGAYAATPMQMAEAYTMFANGGVEVKPRLLYSVQTPSGRSVYSDEIKTKRVLDPRIAFLTTNMMESVLDYGTAVRARELDFNAPAAAKTGTSRDGWFAGYTSNLLCIVWVGMDDYSDLGLEGAKSALPIWVAFMKRAIKVPAYRRVTDFQVPQGIVAARVDDETLQLATPACPKTHLEFFIEGTEPKESCSLHQPVLSPQGIANRVLGLFHASSQAPPPPSQQPINKGTPPRPTPQPVITAVAENPPPPALPPEKAKKKKGFFARIFGGSDDHKGDQQPQQGPAPPQSH